MKELILEALHLGYKKTVESAPASKRIVERLKITDVEPTRLHLFMMDKGVPNTAYFDTYDDDVYLAYVTVLPTTPADIDKHMKDKFEGYAYSAVYKSLSANGYTRIGFDVKAAGSLLSNRNLYAIYAAGEMDVLCEYFALMFK